MKTLKKNHMKATIFTILICLGLTGAAAGIIFVDKYFDNHQKENQFYPSLPKQTFENKITEPKVLGDEIKKEKPQETKSIQKVNLTNYISSLQNKKKGTRDT